MSQVALFAEAGLIGKCVTVSRDGSRTEDTKLFRIDLSEIEDPDAAWEESSFRAGFSGAQLLCIVFEGPSAEAPLAENRLLGFKRLAFGDGFVEKDVRSCWDGMREVTLSGNLRSGVLCTKSGRVRITPKTGIPMEAPNWLKSADGNVFVRGSGKDALDKVETVAGVRMYRQNVWLKGTWICERLAELPYL